MDCKTCHENRAVVSFAAFERAILELKDANRRLWIIVLLLIMLLFGTNAAWLYYESQWETVSETTVTQDLKAEGGDAIINDGVHINGESAADGND